MHEKPMLDRLIDGYMWGGAFCAVLHVGVWIFEVVRKRKVEGGAMFAMLLLAVSPLWPLYLVGFARAGFGKR